MERKAKQFEYFYTKSHVEPYNEMCPHTIKNFMIIWQWKQIQGYKAVNRAFSVCRTYQGCSFVIHGGDHDGTCTSNDTPPPPANLSVVHSQSVFTFLSVCFCAIISSPLLLCLNSYTFIVFNAELAWPLSKYLICVYYEYIPKHTSYHVSIALWHLYSLTYDILTTVVKNIYLCCRTSTI